MINKSASAALNTKYAIGEIEDFVGVPDFYDAGTSKWLRSNTWVAAANLSVATQATLKASGATKTAMTDNAALAGSGSYVALNTLNPLAKTASVTAIALSTTAAGQVARALLVESTGFRSVGIGQTVDSGVGTPGNGGTHIITSDGATLWSWTPASASAFGAYSSADNGATWASASLTGQATFSSLTASNSMGPHGNQNNYIGRPGEAMNTAQTKHSSAMWCGARHVLIGTGATNLIAQRSTTGLAWGGDESTAILGSATVGNATNATQWMYRNGNNFYFSNGAISRSTTDGGVTWAAATNGPLAAITVRHKVNASDAARLVSVTTASTTLKFSINSGAAWTTRTAPFTTDVDGTTISGRGATWLICDGAGNAYKTVDDGANWTVLAAPVGFTSIIQGVYADANRYYLVSVAGNQVATSTDATSWTVRNIANPSSGTEVASTPQNLVATDTDNIMGANNSGEILYSSDGGVTWAWSSPSSHSSYTASAATYYVANTVGSGSFLCGLVNASSPTRSNLVLAADLATGGKYYRSTAATVAPLRTNAVAYSRIA